MARKKSTKRTDGRYVATLIDGDTRRYFYSTISKADAERKKMEFMYAALHADESPVGSDMTFNAWREKWLASYKSNLSANTIAQYQSVSATIGKFLFDNGNGKSFGEMQMRDFLPIHIAKYVISLDGKSRSTISIHKLVLNDIFSTAEDNNVIEMNPCKKMPKVNGTYSGHHALTREQINVISNNYFLHKNGVLFLTLLYTGMRRGEAFALRWENIDFLNGVIHIKESHDCKHNVTKGPKSQAGYRDVPLLPPIRKALFSVRQDSGLVFPMPDGSYITDCYANTILDSFLCFCERVLNGVPHPENCQGFRRDVWMRSHDDWRTMEFNYHDLRDTYATLLYDANVDIKTAQRLMGHSSADITMNIYTKLSDERNTDSVDKLSAFCDSISEKCGQNVVRAVF